MNIFPFLGLIVLILVFGLAGLLSPQNKMNSSKKKVYLLSLISTVIFAFIPTGGYQVDSNGYLYFGFPAESFVYRGGLVFTFSSLGLLFNFFLFYWFFKLLLYLWRVLKVQVKM
ncbi:hypothetical protein [Lysinibacillus sp. UBA5990]|uniref:hypothetical protein n=1 Tax=Lysinibacillus sp. UBA5990 TaxID=1946773 RepID=UPI0025BFBAFD|nr:hypothetical protein [Lysinibacillus sp. UBA5990]